MGRREEWRKEDRGQRRKWRGGRKEGWVEKEDREIERRQNMHKHKSPTLST